VSFKNIIVNNHANFGNIQAMSKEIESNEIDIDLEVHIRTEQLKNFFNQK